MENNNAKQCVIKSKRTAENKVVQGPKGSERMTVRGSFKENWSLIWVTKTAQTLNKGGEKYENRERRDSA